MVGGGVCKDLRAQGKSRSGGLGGPQILHREESTGIRVCRRERDTEAGPQVAGSSRALGSSKEPGVLRAGHEAGLNGWRAGGRLVAY